MRSAAAVVTATSVAVTVVSVGSTARAAGVGPSSHRSVHAPTNGLIVVGAQWPLDAPPRVVTAGLDGRDSRSVGPGALPSFSPDGRQIAYVGLQGDRLGVWVVRADGAARRWLALAPAGALSVGPLQWSPDGRHLLTSYTTYDALCGGVTVVTLDVVRGGMRRIAAGKDPHWSPDGTRITYERVAFVAGDQDCGLDSSAIVESGPDGTHAFELARGRSETGEVYDATWSPRGDLIAFIGRAGLIVTRPDGGGRRLLDPRGVGGITWSPDGSRIASQEGDYRNQNGPLVIVELHGRPRIRKIALDAYIDDFSQPVVSWSPDGRRFLYATGARLCTVAATIAIVRCSRSVTDVGAFSVDWRGRRFVFSQRTPQHNVLVGVNADGGDPVKLTDAGGSLSAMPDGRVAFVIFRKGMTPPEDWALDPVTRTQTRLLFAFDRAPAWSPDGTMIAAGSVSSATIEVGNADGTALHGLPTMDGDSEPAWSPDGTRIAFTNSGSNTLGVIAADGTGLTVFSAPRDAHSPAWSPDGSSIAFAWHGDGVNLPGIYEIAPDGSALHQLVRVGEPPGAVCWSPDGTTLAFTTESYVTRLLPDGSVTDAGEWKLWIQGPYRGASLMASGTTENGGIAPLAWVRR